MKYTITISYDPSQYAPFKAFYRNKKGVIAELEFGQSSEEAERKLIEKLRILHQKKEWEMTKEIEI